MTTGSTIQAPRGGHPSTNGFAPSDVALALCAAVGVWAMRRALARRFRGD